MSPQKKVEVSQWMITLVACTIGFVSGYKLLQYKVEENKTKIDTHCTADDVRFNKASSERFINSGKIIKLRADVDHLQGN